MKFLDHKYHFGYSLFIAGFVKSCLTLASCPGQFPSVVFRCTLGYYNMFSQCSFKVDKGGTNVLASTIRWSDLKKEKVLKYERNWKKYIDVWRKKIDKERKKSPTKSLAQAQMEP